MRKQEYKAGTFDVILEEVFRALEIENIFSNSGFDKHPDPGHKKVLITLIIRMYMKRKHDYISRCNTQNAHESYIRSYLRKYTHFRGQ